MLFVNFYFSIFDGRCPCEHHVLSKARNLLSTRLLQLLFDLVLILNQTRWKCVRILPPKAILGDLLVVIHNLGNFVEIWNWPLRFQIWEELLNMWKLSYRHLIIIQIVIFVIRTTHGTVIFRKFTWRFLVFSSVNYCFFELEFGTGVGGGEFLAAGTERFGFTGWVSLVLAWVRSVITVQTFRTCWISRLLTDAWAKFCRTKLQFFISWVHQTG